MDPRYIEANILPIFYDTTLTISLLCPLFHLYLSHIHPRNQFKLGISALVTVLANVCNFNEPYSLSQPIYVSFPDRGETFHHPEETRLTVQWVLYLGAAMLAGLVAGLEAGKWVLREVGLGRVVSLGRDEAFEKENVEEREKDDRLGDVTEENGKWEMLVMRSLRNTKALMTLAWCLTVCGYFIMYGRSKKSRFGNGFGDEGKFSGN